MPEKPDLRRTLTLKSEVFTPEFRALLNKAAKRAGKTQADWIAETLDPLLEADQINLSGFEVVDSFQEFLERAPQAIEADDGQGIVGSGLIKQGCQTGPVERLAGDYVFEHANRGLLPDGAKSYAKPFSATCTRL